MSILISPTLANDATPYYLTSASISGEFVPAITSVAPLSAVWGAVGAGYPLTAAAGQVVGQTFVAPRSGFYLVEVNMGFNVSPSAVVAGTGDLVIAGLAFNEPFFGIVGASTIQPLNMPSSGADYGLESSFVASLTAGITYTLFWYVVPTSGTLNLGEANGAVTLRVLPLC